MALIGDEIGIIAVHKFIAAAEAAEEIADGADGKPQQPRVSDAPDSKSTSSRATESLLAGLIRSVSIPRRSYFAWSRSRSSTG
jgi:hypothetical protein